VVNNKYRLGQYKWENVPISLKEIDKLQWKRALSVVFYVTGIKFIVACAIERYYFYLNFVVQIIFDDWDIVLKVQKEENE